MKTRDHEAFVRNGRILLSTTVDLGNADEAEHTMSHFPEEVREAIQLAIEEAREEERELDHVSHDRVDCTGTPYERAC